LRRSEIYAVIRSGGKQYKVKPDQLLDVERLRADVGAVVELPDVLMVADGDDVTVGQPRVTGARVVAEVVEHGRGPKLIVFKYKNKTRYRKKTGHRQAYTRLAIRQILIGAEPAAAAAPVGAPAKARPRRAPAKPVVEAEAAPPEAAEVPQVEEETVAAEAPPEAVAEAEASEAPAVEEPAPAEAAAPTEAPKARRPRAAAPKATGEAPPKPSRPRPAPPRPAPRTKREE
jgi:large subunit ribosomal protein L21